MFRGQAISQSTEAMDGDRMTLFDWPHLTALLDVGGHVTNLLT